MNFHVHSGQETDSCLSGIAIAEGFYGMSYVPEVDGGSRFIFSNKAQHVRGPLENFLLNGRD
jgi:hypothetical protein